MSQHSRFTTILEQSLDRDFAEHGYLDSVIEMWENMMFVAEYNSKTKEFEWIKK